MKTIFSILYLMPLFALACLTGCTNPVKANLQNQANAQCPQTICTMPDGRTLYCIKINNVQDSNYHFIYYFGAGDTNTVSINYPVSSGKTTHNQAIVIMDGHQYKLVPVDQ